MFTYRKQREMFFTFITYTLAFSASYCECVRTVAGFATDVALLRRMGWNVPKKNKSPVLHLTKLTTVNGTIRGTFCMFCSVVSQLLSSDLTRAILRLRDFQAFSDPELQSHRSSLELTASHDQLIFVHSWLTAAHGLDATLDIRYFDVL